MRGQPIFQPIFGEQWQYLPPVMHRHYANRPFCADKVTVQGLMNIEFSLLARLLAPLMRWTGTLAPYAGEGVPVTVHFESEPDGDAFRFHRIFHYAERGSRHFRSRMVPVGGDEIVEMMAMGIGWRAAYGFDGKKVRMRHRGYQWVVFGKRVRLPLEIILGRGYAEEEAINDESFRMYMEIRHPLFGRVYAYRGEFTLSEVMLDA